MTVSRTTRALAAGAVCASLAATVPAAAAARAPGQAAGEGAPGIGDPYFPLEGNGGYDVQHYNLRFSYDPATDRLDGVNVITAKSTQRLSRFNVDLQQLDVSAVTVNHKPAEFTRDGQEVQITPSQRINKNAVFRVAVAYGGVPETVVGSPIVFGSPYGFLHTPDGAFMGDEPNVTSTWIPLNDHPSDKATWTFRVTVPKGLGVVANGNLVSQRTRGDHSTFVWNERFPMSNYLATADIGHWVMKTGKTPGGIPETVAVDPAIIADNPTAVDYYFDTTAEATDLWTDTFGPYPFDSTGAIVDDARFNGQPLGFSLETQTRPLYSGFRSTSTIAHELAHQWFGDAVSVKTWDNIWLNEGFASFAQYLWSEHLGTQTGHESFLQDYSRPADSAFWQSVIADPQRDTMFNSAVYRRGAMTLQALREKIGDDAFFQILRTWVAQHRYGTATTDQFIALSEQVSGQDLDSFFQTWLYTPGKPTTW